MFSLGTTSTRLGIASKSSMLGQEKFIIWVYITKWVVDLM